LTWTAYQGPRFEAYKIHRQAAGIADQIVKELPDVKDTTYVDTQLDGNTWYTYWISVRTTWGIEVSSNEDEGIFYALEDEREFRLRASGTRPHAIGIALDEQDGLYVVMTTISTTMAMSMSERIESILPGDQEAGRYEVTWDGKGFANGVYFYRLEAGEYVDTRRMVHLK
jgi:hypothetical protein